MNRRKKSFMVTYTICKYKVKGKYSKFSIQIKRRNWMCYLKSTVLVLVWLTQEDQAYIQHLFVPHSETWPFKTKMKKEKRTNKFRAKIKLLHK